MAYYTEAGWVDGDVSGAEFYSAEDLNGGFEVRGETSVVWHEAIFGVWGGNSDAPGREVSQSLVVVLDGFHPVVAESYTWDAVAFCWGVDFARDAGVVHIAYQHAVRSALGQFGQVFVQILSHVFKDS